MERSMESSEVAGWDVGMVLVDDYGVGIRCLSAIWTICVCGRMNPLLSIGHEFIALWHSAQSDVPFIFAKAGVTVVVLTAIRNRVEPVKEVIKPICRCGIDVADIWA